MDDSKRILLVEDYEDNRLVFTMLLEHHGYEVLAVEDGETAVATASREPLDLILMDLSLPGIDGWSAIERIREQPEHVDTPIVPITAHALPEVRERADELGCAGFLTKPCAPDVILAEVRRATGESSDPPPDASRVVE